MSGVVGIIANPLFSGLAFSYGLFTMGLYALVAIRYGYFFRKPTEKENLELQLARNELWDLSHDYHGLSHCFLTLHNGFRFHYLCNEPAPSPSASVPDASGINGSPTTGPKPLIIFIHGFPDSWAVWRHIITSKVLQETATLVAVDLPGYGGSDNLAEYSATNVLESLAGFVVAVRARYGVDSDEAGGTSSVIGRNRVVIVGHDWGCALGMRLAAEAPSLADRFVLSNGPLISLAISNFRRLLSSSLKMFKTSLPTPIRSRSTLLKAIKSLRPLATQLFLSGYVFVMRLPLPFVQYLGRGRNHAFLRMVHVMAYNESTQFTTHDAVECLASTLGPSRDQSTTHTTRTNETYPASVRTERSICNFHHMANYYRDGATTLPWQKTVETVAALHTLSQGTELRRASSGAGIFDESPPGVLKAFSTVIWGKMDTALEPSLCLDGISDYLVGKSQVVELPRSGHFTPIERESRVVLRAVVEWAGQGEWEDVGGVVRGCYEGSVVTVRK